MAKKKAKASGSMEYTVSTVDAPPVRFRSSEYDQIVKDVKEQLDSGAKWATVKLEDADQMNAVRNRIRSTIGVPTKSRIVDDTIYIALSSS